jgi:hypothetical protein
MIDMERNVPPEYYVRRKHDGLSGALRESLARWGKAERASIMEREPDMPDGIDGRLREICLPLIVVADEAGGHWPESIRQAVCELLLSAPTADEPTLSLVDQLLTDLRDVMGSERHAPTRDLADRLVSLPNGPWRAVWPQDADRELAMMLRTVGVEPKAVRTPDRGVVKGIRAKDLAPLWADVVTA